MNYIEVLGNADSHYTGRNKMNFSLGNDDKLNKDFICYYFKDEVKG